MSIEGEAAAADAGGTGEATLTTALGTAEAAKDDKVDDKKADVVEGEKNADGTPKAAVEETAEAKAERLKNETPEAKAKREGEEKVAAEKKTADTLKTYDALKMPEGMAKDQPVVADFLKTAATKGLSIEQTQALVDDVGPKLKEATEAPYKAWATMNEGWLKEMKSDKEIGGADLQANLGLAAKAIDTICTTDGERKAFRSALEFTGAGNNPDMARFLIRVGKMLAEGGPLGGRSKQAESLAKSMYPTMAQS